MHISSGRWVYGFFLTLLTAFLWGILPIKLKQVLQVRPTVFLAAFVAEVQFVMHGEARDANVIEHAVLPRAPHAIFHHVRRAAL